MSKLTSSITKQFININFLICSVLTLDPQNNIFKKTTFKKDVYLDPNTANQNSLLTPLDEESYEKEFYELLNKYSIRQMAYEIIKPILIKKRNPNIPFNKKKIKILKKYLKKFKILYKKFFLDDAQKPKNLRNDNIINSSALYALFLIAGI